MSRSPKDPLAEQLARTLEALAPVLQISETLLAQIANNASVTARLENELSHVRAEMVEVHGELRDLQAQLDRGDSRYRGDSLTLAVSKLISAVESLEKRMAEIFAAEKEHQGVDRTGKWNMRVAIINGLFVLLGALLGAGITALLQHLASKP